MDLKPTMPCSQCGGTAVYAFRSSNILGPYSVAVSYVYECPCGHMPYVVETERPSNRAGRSARHAWKDRD